MNDISIFKKNFLHSRLKRRGGGGEGGRLVGGVRGSWTQNGANTALNVHNCNV